jgi:hypothetical protein
LNFPAALRRSGRMSGSSSGPSRSGPPCRAAPASPRRPGS